MQPEARTSDAGREALGLPREAVPDRNVVARVPGHGRLGLAFSGGGSRAAAFHAGTVRALNALGLMDQVDAVSTVSGGSVFGGAWMAARGRGMEDAVFLERLARELEAGFVARSLRPSALKVLLPGHTRTEVIADTFDRVFFQGATLRSLPEKPQLCINTTVLNHGQVGKFSRLGFETIGIPPVPLPDFRLALAVAASAAFPVGLPPLLLSRERDLPSAIFKGELERVDTLALSDGGVLENLGAQTLLRSRFKTWDLVISDAGTRAEAWRPTAVIGAAKSALIGVLSGGALDQVMIVMNDKQNRWMREGAFHALEESWTVQELRSGRRTPGLDEWLSEQPVAPARRRVLMPRVNQRWDHLITTLVGDDGRWRLVELAQRAGKPLPSRLPQDAAGIEALLATLEVDLTRARQLHQALGGDARCDALNQVPTNFTALKKADVDGLAAHGEWQVHALHAIYW